MKGAELTIWDSVAPPPTGAAPVYAWNGHGEAGATKSLLRYVEAHGDRLRSRYLAWVHDLGESRSGGRSLIDHLGRRDGPSLWWMTLLAEKNPWKSPSLVDALRVLALEEIAREQGAARIRLVSAHRALHLTMVGLAGSLGCEYTWTRTPKERRPWNFRRLYDGLPLALRGLLSLGRYVRVRWPLRETAGLAWCRGDRAVFFCSYFLHLDRRAAHEGRFQSHQWGALSDLLESEGYEANWIHHYLKSDVAPDPGAARLLAGRFNQTAEGRSCHALLERFLSWRIVGRAAWGWLRLSLVSWRLGGMAERFRPAGSAVSLWPLLRRDWASSLWGPTAATNLLWIELFDAAMADLPKMRSGFYLCENQGWERALIHAWRRHGHGRLVGVAHSTVRFWDLRYFADPRTIRATGEYAQPQPDTVVLNGQAAESAYGEANYPAATVTAEALRYIYLENLRRNGPRRPAPAAGKIEMLILGDYMPAANRSLLGPLEAIWPGVSHRLALTIKPHPGFPIQKSDYPALDFQLTREPLEGILPAFDLVYAGNATSAAVDAYLAGLRVIVALDQAQLNFSPLRGRPGVGFVSTPEELTAALDAAEHEEQPGETRDNFFLLDRDLPRWKQLLSG